MPEPRLVLFDDDIARQWEPFALTRPAGELLLGAYTLRARAEAVLGLACVAHLGPDHLVGFDEEGAPPVLSDSDPPAEGARLFLLARVVPEWEAARRIGRWPDTPARVSIGGRTVGWFAPEGAPAPERGFFRDPQGSRAPEREIELRGQVLESVWELVGCNQDQITRDVAHRFPDPPRPPLPPGVHHWGEHPLVLGEDVRIEPGAALDTTDGPIWIERGSTIRAFTRLAGPAYIGPGCSVLGGTVECVSLGPVCKVRGELTTSVCLGYVNKAHAGHMGHAYLGRWVNLGAETTNSDLKNNYGTIRIWTPAGERDTGEIKLGSFLGDHVKTGIGLLLNTGTVVGAGSNLYGAAMPPTYVPPFSWGTGEQLVEYRLDKFLEVTESAMERRDVRLTDSMREQLRRAWERGRADAGT